MFTKIRVSVNDGAVFGVRGRWFVHVFTSDDIFGANYRMSMRVFNDKESADKAASLVRELAKTIGA